MKTTLLIGASSDIAKELFHTLKAKGERVITISRTEVDFPSDQHFLVDWGMSDSLPAIDGEINSLIYFPGSITLKPFRSIKPADFQADFEINVLNAIRSVQAYLPNLKLANQASILFFSSVAVQQGMSFHATIGVNKGAIEGLTRALAAEFAPAIRVNCIALSLTDTKLAGKLTSTPEKIDAIAQKHPMKRIGNVQDVANYAAFVTSDQATWITGQVLHLDGGMSTLKNG
jgi:NAD(P)-dependent dehydrogenase (short-subunit alcohol dehydrogenase family)